MTKKKYVRFSKKKYYYDFCKKSKVHLFKGLRQDLILCGQTSFCKARPYSVIPHTSIYKAIPHSLKPDIIL